ncbi:MAG: restriction endonuclease subunit S [Nitrospira sp.]|uniref:Type I site-specific deoxyribonuclease n=1 Tax=Nitrospira defluvii TaxID=330214 RepID=A0ABN7LXN7_9BACT|nr:restriction endonuclease subunit S [Nitrospira defluvii]MCS6328298.1 restriction endonuclease subunit S [Nitrospira sp.]CAE6773238.1 putative Type I site-specific deoxyribonuclease [Nitrospira defluvii]
MDSDPKTWTEALLYSFCNPKQWPTIPQNAFTENGYPVYGANGKIGFYNEFNHEKPTVLITCRGATCGAINVCEPKSYVTGNSMALDDLDEARVDLKFLVYALRNHGLGKAITGTAQPQITRESLTSIKVPLPPLNQQRRIAAILDKADELRAKRRAALAKLDNLTQSIFLDMFGDPATNDRNWPTKMLQELCHSITDIDHNMPATVEQGVPFISAKDLSANGHISFEDVKRIAPEDFRRLSRKSKPEKGDIIYSRIGVNLGKARRVEVDFDFLASYSCCTIKPNLRIVDGTYLCQLLDSPFILRQARRGIRAIAVPDLGLGEIKAFRIIVPPIELQMEFARRISNLGSLKNSHRASAVQINKIFASLQHRAFRGEL